MQPQHVPVLLREVLESLAVKPAGVYLDVTGGWGGHSAEILQQLGPSGRLYISDYHRASAERLQKKFSDDARVTVFHERFAKIFEVVAGPFDGILADFGISSPQLEDSTLGIGFAVAHAPLDMRLDDRLAVTAADVLATYTESELADLFFYLGGEVASRKIARAIVNDRQQQKFETTDQLLRICESVLGRFYRKKKINPATKIFQALRIEVNRELQEVEEFLTHAPSFLAKNGILVTIAFHEGEDRLVKQRFRALAQTDSFTLQKRKAIKPSESEVQQNPRARSAKLRTLCRVG